MSALALVAMLVRAIVPVGFMIAQPHAGNGFAIALCSGHGPAQLAVDLRTGAIVAADKSTSGKHQKDAKPDAPCVFAAAAHVAPPVLEIGVPAPARPVGAAFAAILSVSPGRGLAAPPPWPTGPPSNV